MLHEKLLEHFSNPRNVGDLAAPAITVDVENPACGDMLRLSVRFDGDRAVETRYRVRGCSASIAAGSALTELISGKTASELSNLRAVDIESEIGELQAASKHAAALCLDAVKALLKAWKKV